MGLEDGNSLCTGTLSKSDVEDVIGGYEGLLSWASETGSASLTFKNANLTGVTGLVFLDALYMEHPTSLTLKFDGSFIAKNQIVAFGAAVARQNLDIDVQVVNCTIVDNMLIAAAGASVAGSGSVSLTLQSSQVSGNMAAGAGALAISKRATASATGTGGSARNNTLVAAGFVASGGQASADADFESVDASGNTAAAVGLPFVKQPIVTSIIQTVMDAVFVSSGTLRSGLADVQRELCSGMAPGGSIDEWVVDLDAINLSGVLNVANGLLCSNATHIRLSDIPDLAEDGQASPGALDTLQAVKMLATGEGQVSVKSALGLARAMAAHPDAVLAVLENISISPKP
ncbi:hypothetical protein C2E21_1634 [Chlorella sorokiniana]|uniref:Uncharacterized protein n=1 Tax=Chlorella sorokiniana TaxID=3076 RepID=A0A2P6TZN5_CHLSO|nr:hypothetical protein C2E21_1634 [Chlorella sorokiniana]|eukprot:PRW59510.1 hypothetical protein C2E21_1634 [Chlorella sorokiniana]